MQLEVGTVLEGKVTGITKFGAFVELPGGKTGMVHISEVAPTFVKEIRDFVSENQMVKVKILNITPEGKISLSMKKAVEQVRPGGGAARPSRPGSYEWQPSRKNEPSSFEDMLSKFKQTSDEKMLDLKRCMESKRGGFSRHGGSNQAK
ncbi:Polyribonucleotide nucleotidyltransferase [Caprobacter fermentans]|uniref:Polyribonucleotide nucleotidyltransferase n=1 Tax=Caproicibacter fermentans TaxID=2576756 RepID=A0A6N8HWX5_9FIRM|nr:S1 RNA-binding domain-containing protein [Caproicibacter fermentans]MVB10341.1 Polyribonucleotide nucleotidyltransferase [Caproicibacter fermentans]OCN03240.1 RNA-binding protein S1 [Clostridium sp. W14A]QNK40936.1 S1 RNA-binding domain-containing protein [Caproicibacter fermentans]